MRFTDRVSEKGAGKPQAKSVDVPSQTACHSTGREGLLCWTHPLWGKITRIPNIPLLDLQVHDQRIRYEKKRREEKKNGGGGLDNRGKKKETSTVLPTPPRRPPPPQPAGAACS